MFNMSNKKLFSSVLLLIFSAAIIYSQSVLGLQYPFGLPLQNSTGPSLAVGGAGTGVADDFYGMSDNPANLGNVNRAVFSTVFALDLLNIIEDGDRTSHMSFSPRILSFSFPMGIIGSLGLSYSQQTDTELNFRLSRDYPIGNLEETEDLDLALANKRRNLQLAGRLGHPDQKMGYSRNRLSAALLQKPHILDQKNRRTPE